MPIALNTNVATLTSGMIMDGVAGLLNDTAKQLYTYTVQGPYLNLALQELQEEFELNEVPVTDTITAALTIPANQPSLTYGPPSQTLRLPDDMIEPTRLWETQTGTLPYTPMTKVNSLPQQMQGVQINQFQIYVWEQQTLKFLPANTPIDILIEYVRNLFTAIPNPPLGIEMIGVINAQTYLQYKTAEIMSYDIGEDPDRATVLGTKAVQALDRALGIASKGRQNIFTRRRPFRQTFKRRSYL